MDFLHELNPKQYAVVTAGNGPLAIVAGPGTGKTKTLTARIAYLMSIKRVPAGKILALTFTNKAAHEMRTRVQAMHAGESPPHITTFHALCYELLQQGSAKPLNIVTEQDRLQFLRSLKKSHELKDISLRELATQISNRKSQPIGSESSNDAMNVLLASYNQTLESQGMCDFDDLLQQLHARLQTDAVFRKSLQARFSYLLVDEFQDTNNLQYELLQLINRTDNICVIGDPLQSIYGFRGASAAVFDRFATDWPSTQHIVLDTNYRSVPQVVALANELFPNAPALMAYKTENGSAQVVEVLNEYAEAAFIIRTIEQNLGGTSFERTHQLAPNSRHLVNHTFKNYAVLYRTHRVAKTLQRAFAECGIPYQVAGEGSPYEQPNIQKVLHVMRCAAMPSDVHRAMLIRALPRISERQLDILLASISLKQPPSAVATDIAHQLQLLDTPAKRQSFTQFTNSLIRCNNLDLPACIEQLDVLAEQNFYDPHVDAVTLLTIHAAKGLEFDHIFLIACEDGILPHQQQNRAVSPGQFEEERRLLYVAITRARLQLHVLRARFRASKPTALSPFLQSLPDKILPRTIDPELASQERAQKKRQLRRAQTSLF